VLYVQLSRPYLDFDSTKIVDLAPLNLQGVKPANLCIAEIYGAWLFLPLTVRYGSVSFCFYTASSGQKLYTRKLCITVLQDGNWYQSEACVSFRISSTSYLSLLTRYWDLKVPKLPFIPRDAMHSVDYAVARCLSVCPSVRHTLVFCRNGYLQTFFTIGYPHHSSFSVPNGIAIFRRGLP